MTNIKDILVKPKSTLDQPIPLESSSPAVEKLTNEMLPDAIGPYIYDVSARTQGAAEYVAVATITAISAVVGNKFLIMPKQQDDWEVKANMWAALIGPPSAMKSPTLKDPQRPLVELEKENALLQKQQTDEHEILSDLSNVNKSALKKEAAELLQKGKKEDAILMMQSAQMDDAPPHLERIIVNDATVPKLGELLNENPNGMLLVRDELSGFIAKLAQEDSQMDRAFYLECFDGNGRFTYDRIARGTIVIDNCMLSILGGIQPSKLARTIRSAMNGSADDGLIQRFQLTVWPDPITNWQWKDQKPCAASYDKYRSVIREINAFTPPDGETIKLHFTPEAQELFAEYMTDIQSDIRNEDYHQVIQSHFAKSPKTIAGLALLFEIIDGGRNAVDKEATLKALCWAKFLKSHALRLYHITVSSSINNAKLIFKRRGKLKDTFTARELRRKGWAGLSENREVQEGLSYRPQLPD